MQKGFYYNTIIGMIGIIEENGIIVNILFGKGNNEIELEETQLIKKTFKQIQEYLDGKREKFDIPIKYEGTDFKVKVWESLLNIPYNKTKSYADIANEIDNPKSCRAVGMACNANPLPILIPCHRVIGKNGELIGFGGGLDIKSKLLKIEKGE